MTQPFDGPKRTLKFIPKRGFEADRLGYIPEDGEFIYIIDKNTIWIGDGYRPGGWYVGKIPKEVTYISDYVYRVNRKNLVKVRAEKIWACRPWYKRLFL